MPETIVRTADTDALDTIQPVTKTAPEYQRTDDTSEKETDLLWKELKKAGSIYTPRYNHSMVFERVSRRVFIFGGDSAHFYSIQRYFGDLYEYNLENSTWSLVCPQSTAPCPRAGQVMLAYKKRLHVFGGASDEGLLNDFWSFDPKLCVWAQRTVSGEIPPPRKNATGVLLDGSMYIFGGTMKEAAGTVWRLALKEKVWHKIEGKALHNALPASRSLHAATVFAGQMYVFGGATEEGFTNEVWRFDPEGATWELLKVEGAEPSGRAGHASVLVGTRWVIHGGKVCGLNADALTSPPAEDAWAFNFKQLIWMQLPACVVPFCQPARFGHQMALVENSDGVSQTMMLTGGVTLAVLPLH